MYDVQVWHRSVVDGGFTRCMTAVTPASCEHGVVQCDSDAAPGAAGRLTQTSILVWCAVPCVIWCLVSSLHCCAVLTLDLDLTASVSGVTAWEDIVPVLHALLLRYGPCAGSLCLVSRRHPDACWVQDGYHEALGMALPARHGSW